MTPLDLVTFAAWTLAADGAGCALKVGRTVEWCVDGACAPVERVVAERPDRWVLEPSGVAVRWSAPDTAEASCAGVPVVLRGTRASASAVAAPDVPWAQVAGVVGVEPEVVVPGAWSGGTRACVEGTQAWLFEPFEAGRPDVFAARDGDVWLVAKGRPGVVMCAGGRAGGIYPAK